jgi:hypothetical protein
MRLSSLNPGRTLITGVSVLAIVMAISVATPLLSAHGPSASMTITNNTSRVVSHVYLSHTDQNDWGPDLLNDAAISAGASVSVGNVACPASEVKVIAEDADGCFLYQVVSCGETTAVTLSNEVAPDCGG